MRKRPNKDELLVEKDQRIAKLEEQLAQALAANQKLLEQVKRLQRRVEELERGGRRQAAPFARRKLVSCPKKAGRKAGKGQFKHREKPDITQVSETKTADLDGCPVCGSQLQDLKEHEQYEIDIPKIEPVITRFMTHSGYCQNCHKRVRSRHPEQTSQANGAAGVVVGPRAKGMAVNLKHRLGVS
jgi:transposase